MPFRNLRDPILKKQFDKMSDGERELAKNEVYKAIMAIRNNPNLSNDIKHAIGLGVADGMDSKRSGGDTIDKVFGGAAELQKAGTLEAKRRAPFSPMPNIFGGDVK